MAPSVLINERALGPGRALGHITLNAEATLNSLSLEMIDLIQAALDRWRSQADIIAIFFDAAGQKRSLPVAIFLLNLHLKPQPKGVWS